MVKKSVLDIDENTWAEVQKYKIDKRVKRVNEVVVELIKRGLESIKKGNRKNG